MGHSQSSAASSKQSAPAGSPSSSGSSLPPFQHPVILQGLRGAGKSTVAAAMSLPEGRILTVPDEFLTKPAVYDARGGNNFPGYGWDRKDANFDDKVWTYGGRGSVMALWSVVAFSCRALVFVVDSTDRAAMAPLPGAPEPKRLPDAAVRGWKKKSVEQRENIMAELRKTMTARDVLETLRDEYSRPVQRKPVLVLATKQDQPGALPPAEIAELLGLTKLERVDWRISGCNAVSGEGLEEAFDWLTAIIAAPTDFTEQWKEFHKRKQVEYDVERKALALRETRLKLKYVLAAPRPLPARPDGSAWPIGPEFVTAPLTPLPDDEEGVVERSGNTVNSANTTTADEEANKTLQAAAAAGPVQLVEKIVEAPVQLSSPVESSVKEVPGEVSLNSSTRSRSSSSGSSDKENDELPSQNSKLPQPPEKEKEPAAPSPAPSSGFVSLSSTSLALPASSRLPRLGLEYRKKHWYSRKEKLLPAKSDRIIENIHKVMPWGGVFF